MGVASLALKKELDGIPVPSLLPVIVNDVRGIYVYDLVRQLSEFKK